VQQLLARGALLAGLLLASSLAIAQGTVRPAWNELSPEQREALAPLAKDWPTLDATRKRKWLEVAARYPNLTPDGKKKLHERMGEFARLTPDQKKTARENFRMAYEVPAEQRQATVQKFQELPPDKKRELADRAAAKSEAPRRPAREADVKPARPPAKSEPKAQ
jgi:hypothetical protein